MTPQQELESFLECHKEVDQVYIHYTRNGANIRIQGDTGRGIAVLYKPLDVAVVEAIELYEHPERDVLVMEEEESVNTTYDETPTYPEDDEAHQDSISGTEAFGQDHTIEALVGEP